MLHVFQRLASALHFTPHFTLFPDIWLAHACLSLLPSHLQQQFRKLFGSYNFGQMIETSYLSISALSTVDVDPGGGGGVQSRDGRVEQKQQPDALVGFAILSDTPRAGVSEDWLEWFSETHAPADAEVTMTNTLWVDFAVAISPERAAGVTMGAAAAGREDGGGDTAAAREEEEEEDEEEEEEAAAGVIEDIVRTVFNTLPEIDYLVISLPGNTDTSGGSSGKKGTARTKSFPTPAYLMRAFEVLGRHADAAPNNLDEAFGKPLLLLCDRMAFLPTLAVSVRVSRIGSGRAETGARRGI